MAFRFDPQRFPDRVIFVDVTVAPSVEKMNCLGCGRMADTLLKNQELCEPCYRRWSIEFCREWVHARFGAQTR